MDESCDQTQGEDDDHLNNVDEDDVGQAEVDALAIQLLLDDQEQDDDIADKTDDCQCNKEQNNHRQESITKIGNKS